jgi:hypothetical protein
VVVDAGCELVVEGWGCVVVVAASAGGLKLKVAAATTPIAPVRSVPVRTRLGHRSDHARCLDKTNRSSSVVIGDRDAARLQAS